MEWQILVVDMAILNETLSKYSSFPFFLLTFHAIIALKKGTRLIKYSRKGKPKFRTFRLSPDETALIWLSHGAEKNLKLSTISRIIPGQRTAVFRRFFRPEKEHLSFSLLYNNGDRSLDLICKDKAETDVWLVGLKSLIGQNQNRRTKSDFSDLNGRLFGALEFSDSISGSVASYDIGSSDAGSERASMQLRSTGADGFRISVSSTPSCSSGGSGGPDDVESLGDVYMWGEVWSDGSDGTASSVCLKNDVLTPKPLESNVVLDVHQIACGVRHIALVTKQGEVFTWGEESGGRLGHGVKKDFNRPQLVELLALTNVEFVHPENIIHVLYPQLRVCGALEGLQVLSIACGTWHSALATSNGKLFTFGDGRFGVLGHGDRENAAYPKEVQMLNGLKTVKVACGVWHTAAIVEVSGQCGSNLSSRKLFTWGDGDKHRLGHGSKETYLLPACVSSLIDYNFHQLACGHTITVALTTSGHVFTMGGTSYGQLGNPSSDGKLPCLVQDKLVGEFVEEISCGACHVAVLTSRSEVFTWGRGANGRLGHGDIEDRRTPTLVEALKDGQIKIYHVVQTSLPAYAFGFTKKRHNCYNCGLVHCHACSSKKALKAALAPTPGKPHRVCDACHAKLKSAEADNDKKPGSRIDASQMRASQVPSPLQLRESALPSSLVPFQTAFRQATSPVASPSHSPMNSRSSSPYSRRPSPPRGTNTFSKNVIQSLRKSNEHLNQEVSKLQNQPAIKINSLFSIFERLQVKGLKQKCDTQDVEIQKLRKTAQESASYAVRESSKFKEAKEVVKSITDQLKELTEKLPSEVSERETFKAMNTQAEAFLSTHVKPDSSLPETTENQELEDNVNTMDSGSSREAAAARGGEITEQFEPGVYITFVYHRNEGKIFRRVRFSKRRFKEQQAEEWWSKNKERVLMRYNPNATKPSVASSSQPPPPPPPAAVDETTDAAPPSQT
ncbi:XB3 in, putative isoform 1 [Hibiscus syriacus]|uniref:XB3 in, putative isoform 1 n=1 Tax=Hibiscus syriacus TaxID=106335 RepID=A0A6A2YP80_HIBSY|nr:XB3 in, putative isoform 1 [Hibiscus syriacus]